MEGAVAPDGAPHRPAADPGRAPLFAAGLVTALVGFSTSFAVVLAGLRAVGADPHQAVSGLLACCLAVGAVAIWLGIRYRTPIGIAWSTPGAALLAGAGRQHGGYAAAVGAFAVAGVLLVVTALWPRMNRWIARIPAPLASALLASVLLPLCFAPVHAAVGYPALALPPIAAWAVLFRHSRRWAAPGALAIALVCIAIERRQHIHLTGTDLVPHLAFTVPAFAPGALIGIALPLYVVTMAAQNLPGQQVLRGLGYQVDPRPVILTTGGVTALGSGLGVFAVCFAAISAALGAGPEAHPDPRRRWLASVFAGALYVVLGLFAGVATALLTAAPSVVIEAVAGLALLGTLGSALATAFAEPAYREAAAVTLAVGASGITLLSIASPFWGLLAGLALHLLAMRRGKESGAPGR
ncbi:benzoate/H(+) symporter BenE family transporter [Streptomyces sp. DW26H14]|uniref:benzoate/H(+) symporter BenE family transporter n=1 Tax=Streptomyces sp. DW26H14 TaxID=3435395 RepID=UPI00403DAC36